MKRAQCLDLVPKQIKGTSIDVTEERKLSTLTQANDFFEVAKHRLLAVNEWNKISRFTKFSLVDKDGNLIDGLAKIGDLIRIDIPGPGLVRGKGFDWVEIECISHVIHDNGETASMTVRPSQCPLTKIKAVSHFLTANATATFIVKKIGLTLIAEQHGRNENPNLAEGQLLDRGRNLVVSIFAKLGVSYPQWKSLIHGLLYGCDEDLLPE